ncbi:uncharacterized protein LOC122024695 [Zingiber officinale]|uniref:Uncharacterized protein n=1 Tax=Zingiber officinale TaxID=94328 RepID=A0A8J5F493_ZINOF|nr:uncharacterized protein LOC122020980 [Zingiber officinale]XP_042439302.1 uncharacterized protein LOC122024695 [Zingiber officinale]KAG6477938.1 hypothetical protein ZIOFF_061370 [Zingiber officinale]
MANGLIDAIAALVSSWSRHVSRATRKLSGRRRSGSPSDRRKKPSSCDEVDTDEDEGVWRREILMGEKCQPLDFSGAIYYDAFGRQRQEVPTPRSPMRSPLPSFAAKSTPVTAGY